MVKNCINCGSNNEDNANFCSKCGSNFTLTAQRPEIKQTPIGGPSIGPFNTMSPQNRALTHSAIGMCSFHTSLPAMNVCRRCGKAICSNCSLMYMDLNLCPQCYRQTLPVNRIPFAPQMRPF